MRRLSEDSGEGSAGSASGDRDSCHVGAMEKIIRVIIADDHAVFRQGLKGLLGLQPDIELVAEVEKASDLQPVVEKTPCDLLILDLQMDEWVTDQIEALSQKTVVLVLTASERVEETMAAVRQGARA